MLAVHPRINHLHHIMPLIPICHFNRIQEARHSDCPAKNCINPKAHNIAKANLKYIHLRNLKVERRYIFKYTLILQSDNLNTEIYLTSLPHDS